jgi:hypothetical protein
MRRIAIIETATGAVRRIVWCREDEPGRVFEGPDGPVIILPKSYAEDNIGQGESYIDAPEGVIDTSHYFDGTDYVPIPAKTHDYERFDYTTKTWTDPRSLVRVKELKAAELRAAAIAAANADLTVQTVTFSVSLEIRAELAQELALAQAEGAGYSLDWQRVDGTLITLTGAQVKGLLRAMSTRAGGIRSTLRAKLTAAAAAATKAEVNAITW